jgi:hypothetical protein
VVPIPVLVNLIRFLRAFWRSLKDPEFQALFFLVLVTLASGTLYYRQVEVQLGWLRPHRHISSCAEPLLQRSPLSERNLRRRYERG